jgi:3alpha(or 20beta)-hydroxysteroid dehydrogenase
MGEVQSSGRLAGKVAIITGAAGDQGSTEARSFVAEGAQVILSDIRDEEGVELERELGPDARYVHHDVTDSGQWDDVVAAAVESFGGLDVLVNNAGIFAAALIEDETVETFERMVAINQLGVFLGIQKAHAPMRSRGGGSIINISSMNGMRGIETTAIYTGTKWAVRGLSRVAAREFAGDRIRVNVILPGPIDTRMQDGHSAETLAEIIDWIPLGRLGTRAEVAAAAVFLASDESTFCTGSDFLLDGGVLA